MTGVRAGPRGGALRSRRTGASFGDVLLVVSSLLLMAAVVAPRIRREAAEERREEILADVERLREAAESARAELGTWPPTGDTSLPAAVASEAPGRPGAAGEPRFRWHRLETVRVPEPASADPAVRASDADGVEGPEPPPTPGPELFHRGMLSVHGGDEALLATLLRSYGPEVSFVHDSVWTLVLPPVRVPLPRNGGPDGGSD